MKKILFLQIFFILFLLIFSETPSHGASNFTEHYNKGIEFYKQGKYDQAGNEFEQAIEIKPNDVYALYGLGNTYYCKAKYDDAVKVYSKAISINPDYAKVHYSLSLAYSKLGMTREAEKQKSIFRKLSQGEKSADTSHTQATSSHTGSHTGTQTNIDHSPKKTLAHAPVTHEDSHSAHTPAEHTDSHSSHETNAHTDTHSSHAPAKHEDSASSHAPASHEDTYSAHEPAKREDTHSSHAPAEHADSHSTHTPVKHDSGHGDSDSHTIFKGYSGETHKADKRVFTKKPHGTYTFTKNPYSKIKHYVQDRWYTSGINKIWIGTAGFILATQAWLCVVAFFCLIIWRIREKT